MDENGFEMESPVDEGQAGAVDQPETDTDTQELDDSTQDEGAKDADTAAPQPDKKAVQTPEDNAGAAAARRKYEAETKAATERADTFARTLGYRDFAHLEQATIAQQYVDQGYAPDQAQHLATLEAENRQLKAAQQQAQADRDRTEMFGELIAEFPEVAQSGFKLPQEVLDAIQRGTRPLDAYARYEAKRLRTGQAAKEQNAQNKAKALPNMKGAAPTSTKVDPFLEGWGK